MMESWEGIKEIHTLSRGSKLILLGTAWTLFSTLYLSVVAFSSHSLNVPLEPLALVQLLAAACFLYSAFPGMSQLREAALMAQLCGALGWFAWGVGTVGAVVSPFECAILSVCILVGANFSDIGAEMLIEEFAFENTIDIAEPTVRFKAPSRLDKPGFDSGLIAIRPL